MIVARTQVKDILKEAGIRNMSADYLERLSEKVRQIVEESAKRSKENGRRTVMGRDI